VAQVRQAEWTVAGILRQPSIVGRRDDEPVADVACETG